MSAPQGYVQMKFEKGRSCYHCKDYGCVLMSLRPLAKRTLDQKNLIGVL